ncbi:NADH-ubiquinone dehydrogenase [Manganibacter manganicus]|uniref:NADH-ubiquinone dehydrogenase n=1 Tax=Manganibacter manganicus TaxID=1873176 RepID=A0A1V8RWA1_9HYPH|nr:NADH-ubiquinone dehydrogenase [Pseudaminobacter manganicus]OQM77423.1 hypothetical protein BFN67_00835 [Pseudaminobacter manganicus]
MTMESKPTAVLPPDMAGAANLLAHPVAGVAAMSALGVGFASHAFGVWMGALSAAIEGSQRMFDAMSGGEAVNDAAVPKASSGKARARARAVMQQANAYARDIAQTSAEAAGEALTATAPVKPTQEALRQPAAIARPQVPDDLKAIAGIGPKLEAVLNGLGIWTYEQIAAWSADDTAWIEDYVGFSGRIARDGWINQAAALGRQAKNAGSN